MDYSGKIDTIFFGCCAMYIATLCNSPVTEIVSFATILIVSHRLLASKLLMLWHRDQPACHSSNLEETIKTIQSNTYCFGFLKSRALPNQRLVRVFRANNAFTSTDETFCREFKQDATRLLRHVDSQLPELSQKACEVTTNGLKTLSGSNNENILLAPLVRTIVFRFILPVVFPINSPDCDVDQALIITNCINDLWISSRGDAGSTSAEMHKLGNALTQMCPSWTFEETHGNPMNLILPSYETAWRAVLHCFLEISGCQRLERSSWVELLKAFSRNPGLRMYQSVDKENSASVEFLVQEALRLYPPTKSIYRAIPTDSSSSTLSMATEYATIKADIQAIHRNTMIWGNDALVFRPSRWIDANDEQRKLMNKAFLAFGASPRECPAKKVGPMLIAVVVAALVDALGTEYAIVGDIEEADGLLKTGRSDWEDVNIRRILSG